MKKIAVDAMGGDFAPQSVVEGVEKARNKYVDFLFLNIFDKILQKQFILAKSKTPKNMKQKQKPSN